MNIEHISISRKGTFDECPRKYRFHYHDKVISTLPTPFYFDFGKAVHLTIEHHTKNKGEIKVNEIASDIFNGKIELEPGKKCPPFNSEDKARFSKHINNYLHLVEQIKFEGLVEYNFRYDLDPPNGRHVTGLIDRLIIKEEKAFILDFKTSKVNRWRKDSNTITSDIQLACYSWVVMKEFGIPASNISAALYYLEDAKLVPVRFSERTLLEIPKILLEVYKKIENTDPDKAWGNVGNHCNRCSYSNQCPFFSLIK